MNEIENLKAYLANAYPEAKVELTPPARSDGVWWMDIDLSGKHVVVEWNASTGFGVTTPDADSFGEKADESYRSTERVIRRIDQLFVSKDRTSPPFTVLLARLREKRGVTQQELASRLGVKQASISGLERREDIQLSTLRRVVQALGGCVQIFATFPEGRFTLEESLFDSAHFLRGEGDNLLAQGPHAASTVFVQLNSSGKIQHALEMMEHVRKNRALFDFELA
jgi:transcriptional regulator with XRE-family HTH domain